MLAHFYDITPLSYTIFKCVHCIQQISWLHSRQIKASVGVHTTQQWHILVFRIIIRVKILHGSPQKPNHFEEGNRTQKWHLWASKWHCVYLHFTGFFIWYLKMWWEYWGYTIAFTIKPYLIKLMSLISQKICVPFDRLHRNKYHRGLLQ